MKDPRKYNWTSLKAFGIGGIFLVLFTYFIVNSIAPFNFFQYVALIFLYMLFLFLGYSISLFSGRLLHRKVNKPIKLQDLYPGARYWINGATEAIYKGRDEYTGKYHFVVTGIDYSNNLGYSTTKFLPGEVLLYFSLSQEIF